VLALAGRLPDCSRNRSASQLAGIAAMLLKNNG
jgi:hypothetical protein